MKRKQALWIIPLLMAALFIGCPDPVNNNGSGDPDGPALLTGTNVTVAGTSIMGIAVFTGAGSLPLTADDFTLSGDGVITLVYVDFGKAKVSVLFDELNPSFTESRVFTVGISPDSRLIKGTDATVTQLARGKETVTGGASNNIRDTATSATASFNGIVGFTPTVEDFTVDSGGVITGVTMIPGLSPGWFHASTARVTVTFPANETAADKIYTVGIAPTSARLTGDATVAITQKRQASVLSLSAATTSNAQNFDTAVTGAWTLSGSHYSQTRVADPVDSANWVGRYSASGTGNRYTTLTLTSSIAPASDPKIVVVEFDWYPGSYVGGTNNKGPLQISLDTVSSGNHIITFLNEYNSTLKYRLGHFADPGSAVNTQFDGAVEISDTNNKEQWYSFYIVLNFTERTVARLKVTNKATGAVLAETNDLDFVGTPSNDQISHMRFHLPRTDGGNTFYLDNVFVGNGSRP
jgi:hypothetical protein